jgi:outer membrane lipoprotein carrier protein
MRFATFAFIDVKSMQKIIQLILLSLLLPPLTSAAGEQPVDQLKEFLKSAKSLSADFKQISFDENGNPAQTSYGVFYLQRPGKFRWDYQKPYVQQIVSNAGKVWFYDKDLEQVTIRKLDQSIGSTPALLLSGDIPLEENYTIENQGKDDDLFWIRLVPKNDQSGFKYVMIGMDKGMLRGMELSDNFGQLTRIYFSNLKKNVAIKSSMFEFTPPAGTDIFSE